MQYCSVVGFANVIKSTWDLRPTLLLNLLTNAECSVSYKYVD